MLRLKGFSLIELLIVIFIISFLVAIVASSLEGQEGQDTPAPVQDYPDDYGRIKNPDGTPIRPNNDQIGHWSNAGTSSETNTGVTIAEQCIDGILYLLVNENGNRYMAPKENRYGDNERCYE